MSIIQLLHGTDHIIEVPDIHIGNTTSYRRFVRQHWF